MENTTMETNNMENNGTTKLCKSCRVEIDAAATRCPECKSYQSVFRNPTIIMPLLFIPLAFIPLIFIMPSLTRMTHPAEFRDHSGQLTVKVTSVDKKDGISSGSDIVIMGEIANTSEIAWERPTFEILVDTADKKPADVIAEQPYNLKIIPGEKNLFRLKVDSVISPEKIQSVNLRIKDADAPIR